MSNKTVFVPVDPEGFGCGILLGLIIENWVAALLTVLILAGCPLVALALTDISEKKERKERAIRGTVEANSDTATIAVFKQLGSIDPRIRKVDVSWNDFDGYCYIWEVQFYRDRFLVTMDVDSGGSGRHEWSCIRDSTSGIPIMPIENHFEQDGKPTEFEGYQAYSYSDLRPGGRYSFSAECDVTQEVFLFGISPDFDTSTPTPIPQTVTERSSFSNLVFARGIDENNQPVSPGYHFPTSDRPMYLFFDYKNVKPGSWWEHVWMRGDEELVRTTSTWPAEWGTVGTGWVFYAPGDGYGPGSYYVRLLVDNKVVALDSFIVQ